MPEFAELTHFDQLQCRPGPRWAAQQARL
jgi:hypothetical protein